MQGSEQLCASVVADEELQQRKLCMLLTILLEGKNPRLVQTSDFVFCGVHGNQIGAGLVCLWKVVSGLG